MISNSKSDLLNFERLNGPLITKSLERDLKYSDESVSFGAFGTRIISKENIERLNSLGLAYHSIVQSLIEKDFEVRSFFMNNKIWSMAIFSQNDDQTKVDYRAYNLDNPNRMVPFKFEEEEENKIRIFMKMANLDTGSIDFIVTKQGETVF